MPDGLTGWLGDIHAVVPEHLVSFVVSISAVACGGLIGLERSRSNKPAGLRTLILICLGSAIFAQASILIAGDAFADRGRIAAQVVSGIGFLGAGAIIRERGLVIGVTTGASIWATAAVGLVVGCGFIALGVFFSLLILAVLSASPVLDRILTGHRRYKTLHVTYEPGDGKTRFRIQNILDEHMHDSGVRFEHVEAGKECAKIRYCDSHREGRTFFKALLSLGSITKVTSEEA